jgi:hypothetical protein
VKGVLDAVVLFAVTAMLAAGVVVGGVRAAWRFACSIP